MTRRPAPRTRDESETVPPHDEEIEQAFLGCVLLDGGAFVAQASALGVSARTFYAERHAMIWEAAVAQISADAPADLVSVTDRLRETNVLDRAGGASYVTALLDTVPTAAVWEYYARRLLALERRRDLISTATEAIRLAHNITGEGPEAVEARLAALGARLLNRQDTGLRAAFEPVSAAALCAEPDRDPDTELLGPLLVRGARVIVGAHTGHGKTTLALQMIRAVVTRGPFLDWTGAGGRALVIDAEQGKRTITLRLRELALDGRDDVLYVRAPDGLALDRSPEQIAALEAVFAGADYDVVFADPLYKLHVGDSNAEREAVDLMRLFDRWRETYHFALLMATHTRKPPPLGARFTMHEFFGSGAYVRGAEVVLGLERLGAGYARLHFFKDRDGDLPVGARWGLLFDRKNGFTRDPHDGEQRQTAVDKVRDALLATPGMTEARLVAATGYTDRTVRAALRALEATARRGRDGTKFWSLATVPAGTVEGELDL